MKNCLLIIIVFFLSFSAYAKFVDYDRAEKVATAQYYGCLKEKTNIELSNLEIMCASNPSLRNAENRFYVFDFTYEDNIGYVIVSSDDAIKPILAYSLTEKFEDKDISPAQKMIFDYYNDCIEYVSVRNDITLDDKIVDQWDFLVNYDYSRKRNGAYTSPVLLKGINWGQAWPYNINCPEDAKANKSGLKGRTPVGCVAVSACQLMKYYNWPPSGEGSLTHTHTSDQNFDNKDNPNPIPGYGTFTVNFAEQSYNWDRIPGKASNKENLELAKICFHMGVAVKMGWGTSISLAWADEIAKALPKYFHFSEDIKYRKKENYNLSQWEEMLKAEIDAKRPMIYCGHTANAAGHAWNCDGYNTSETGTAEFHMNWGWGGTGNNYCSLDLLVSANATGGEQYNFVLRQSIVCNVIPVSFQDKVYPNHFEGTRYISGQEGSFDDGSGHENYKPNKETIYIIKPNPCGSVINLKFDKFDLAHEDELFVYNGEGEDKILIEKFSSLNNPLNKPLNKQVYYGIDAITIRFVAKNLAEADGWTASYSVANCIGQALSTTMHSGKVTDGSGEDCNYQAGTDCRWHIQPEGANNIKVDFDKFDLADDDYLELFKEGPSTTASNSIAKFTKQNLPSGSYTIDADSFSLRFKVNNNSQTSEGWELSYVANPDNSITDEIFVSDFKIIPNPGDNQSRLLISSLKSNKVRVSVNNALGLTLASKELVLDVGESQYCINEIVNQNLDNGVYFISLISENNIIKTEKLVIID